MYGHYLKWLRRYINVYMESIRMCMHIDMYTMCVYGMVYAFMYQMFLHRAYVYMYVYIYYRITIYVCVFTCIHIIYIYIEREQSIFRLN